MLVGEVTRMTEYDGNLVIEGDGVDPDERAEWDAEYGHE